MRWLVFVAAVASALACSKDPPRKGPAVPRTAAFDAAPAAPSPRDAAPAPASCKTARQCTVTCLPAQGCCRQDCECTRIVTVDQLAEIDKNFEERCADSECVKSVECAKPTHETIADCRGGVCVASRVPVRTRCSQDSDCIASALARGECCPDMCGMRSQGHHKADFPAVKAWIDKTCSPELRRERPRAKCDMAFAYGKARCHKPDGVCYVERLAGDDVIPYESYRK